MVKVKVKVSQLLQKKRNFRGKIDAEAVKKNNNIVEIFKKDFFFSSVSRQ